MSCAKCYRRKQNRGMDYGMVVVGDSIGWSGTSSLMCRFLQRCKCYTQLILNSKSVIYLGRLIQVMPFESHGTEVL